MARKLVATASASTAVFRVTRGTSVSTNATKRNACVCNANARCWGYRMRRPRNTSATSPAKIGTSTNMTFGMSWRSEAVVSLPWRSAFPSIRPNTRFVDFLLCAIRSASTSTSPTLSPLDREHADLRRARFRNHDARFGCERLEREEQNAERQVKAKWRQIPRAPAGEILPRELARLREQEPEGGRELAVP